MVHHVEHALHGHGMRTLAEVLLRTDQANAHLVELRLHDGRIEPVPEGPGAHVDDHVADLRVLSQILQQLTNDRPLVDRLGRVARFDELTVYVDAK
ncbi:hypothetical protein [Nocardia sp. CC201C]|uniref:hypothetical protein n=1 Tax=Nocardia sp. CC201C TaxID=3044575 RepID=UPI0024A924EB|nr:hypothetical protein [Nocardia sp. CC201C]